MRLGNDCDAGTKYADAIARLSVKVAISGAERLIRTDFGGG